MKKTMLFTLLVLNGGVIPTNAVGSSLTKTIQSQRATFEKVTDTIENLEDITERADSTEMPLIEEMNQEDMRTISDSADELAGDGNLEQPKEWLPKLSDVTLPELVRGQNLKTDVFIKMIGEDAKKLASNYNLYASVMIAQAILESGSGNSELAQSPYYNLFGIKGNYKGAAIVMKTQEDDGIGNLFTIESFFRQYPSYEESLEDYAKLLKDGLEWNSDFYKGAWKSETDSYQEATLFLTGKYATDVQYGEKLNHLIDIYQLTRYDEFKHTIVSDLERTELKSDKVSEQTASILTIQIPKKNVKRIIRERKLKYLKNLMGKVRFNLLKFLYLVKG